MRDSRRSAFTIVELLVVISIIGMLAALVLPAVQAARRAAWRTQCINNQKNIGTAVLSFASKRGRMPSYVSERIIPNDNVRLTYIGWVHEIVAELGREDVSKALADIYVGAGAPDPRGTGVTIYRPDAYEVYLPVLNCPVDNHEDDRGAWLSYAANGGYLDTEVSAPCPRDWPANGAFSRMQIPSEPDDCNVSSVVNQGAFPDGATNTFLVVENVRVFKWSKAYVDDNPTVLFGALANYWFDPASVNPNNPNSDVVYQLPSGYANGNIAVPNDRPTVGSIAAPIEAEIADPSDLPNAVPNWTATLPGSQHTGGFTASFCDGRVVFLDDQMDYYVYARLMTSNGAESRPPGVRTNELTQHPQTGRRVPYPVWQSVPLNEGEVQ